jgi:hypothetical protein
MRDLYRGVNEFEKGCHPKSNLVEDESDDLLAYAQDTLNR